MQKLINSLYTEREKGNKMQVNSIQTNNLNRIGFKSQHKIIDPPAYDMLTLMYDLGKKQIPLKYYGWNGYDFHVEVARNHDSKVKQIVDKKYNSNGYKIEC